MAEIDIPQELQDFIQKRIDTVAQMEALLLIRQSDSGKTWTIPEIARRLYVSQAEAGNALHGLCALKLLCRTGESFGLQALSPQDRAEVERLLMLYKRHLIAVTKLIHEKSRPSACARQDAKQ
jgi:hypothetical protein